MENCIFCKIVKGEIPCVKIDEDKDYLAFLDIAPAQPKGGHVLVIPKKHFEVLSELSDKEAQSLMLAVKKMTKILLKWSEGVNVLQNNKSVAGQLVPHVHFHVIPRFSTDSFRISDWKNNKYESKEQMEKVAQVIKSLLKE